MICVCACVCVSFSGFSVLFRFVGFCLSLISGNLGIISWSDSSLFSPPCRSTLSSMLDDLTSSHSPWMLFSLSSLCFCHFVQFLVNFYFSVFKVINSFLSYA